MTPLLHYASAGSGEPLLILHGLFGSSKNWHSYMRRFGEHYAVYCVDLRNHGQSFHDDTMNYAVMADDVARLIDELGLRGCRIIGHSMGGKVAMTLAMRHPGLLSRMIVADIAPVAYDHQYDDLISPILELDLQACSSRGEVDRALQVRIADESLRAFLLHNLARDAQGWHWRVNWTAIQRQMSALTGFDPMPPGWQFELPAQFIRGAESEYVGDQEIAIIREHFVDVRIDTIEGAGHWLHAEKPVEFVHLVQAFL